MLLFVLTGVVALEFLLGHGIHSAIAPTPVPNVMDLEDSNFDKLHDCMCEEKNTQCLIPDWRSFSIQSIQGNVAQFNLSKIIFYDCNFDFINPDTDTNITCNRRTHPTIECANCQTVCLNKTSSCAVHAALLFNKPVNVEITNQNVHAGGC